MDYYALHSILILVYDNEERERSKLYAPFKGKKGTITDGMPFVESILTKFKLVELNRIPYRVLM